MKLISFDRAVRYLFVHRSDCDFIGEKRTKIDKPDRTKRDSVFRSGYAICGSCMLGRILFPIENMLARTTNTYPLLKTLSRLVRSGFGNFDFISKQNLDQSINFERY